MRVLNGEQSRWPVLYAFGMIVVFALGADARAQQPAPMVKIGLPANLFRDIPRTTVDFLMPTFSKLMQSETGLRGETVVLKRGDEGGQPLADNKVQPADFHRLEFACA